ncbi:hypothetical protein SAMN06265375_1211 [Muriicola jejuensis]|uniref:Uncharacterized protein n=1 Tax=Muriicola jejuensis TaxID=504488 RepID=A0A6P0UFK2_9FLAO|nr:DUF6169 family protein [Muriicola jejuensis]NER11797.1 hypothetical protein [Muriicola jejuensis]SMP28232.1 hypothetical protein SAMN06265375_1211 [Muriicola jejuensis]
MYEYIEEKGEDGPFFIFTTDFSLTYIVSFKKMGTMNYPLDNLFSLDFLEENGNKRRTDSKVSSTILHIILEFIKQNPSCVLHYLCDIEGGKQIFRARLFSKWFSIADTGTWNKLDISLAAVENYQISFLYDSGIYEPELIESEIILTMDSLESDKG